jgi:hypothetical protein
MTVAQTHREAKALAVAERQAEREHELAMTKMLLDRLATVTPKRGDIITLTVPAEHFIYPGTKLEDTTEEQRAWMEQCHTVLQAIIDGVMKQGILPGGAAILGEGMTLSDLPPPWEKHPDARAPAEKIVTPGKRIFLPPGTKF